MTPTISRTMAPTEWALLVILSLLWGGSFFFNAVALSALPPLSVVTARVVLGAGLLYLAVKATGATMPRDRAMWLAFATMAALNNVVPFSLIAWGQDHIASGLASILNATTPLFTVVVANAFTADERMTPSSITGVAIGFAGVVILTGPDVLGGFASDLLAEAAILAASLSYAFAVVYARRFARLGLAPLTTACGQIAAAAAIMVPLALVIDQPWMLKVPGPNVLGALAALGALSTFLAYLIYYRILSRAGSVNLMLVTFLIPVTAVLLGTTFLAERLAPHHFVGMAVIGLGLAAIDGRPLAALRRLDSA